MWDDYTIESSLSVLDAQDFMKDADEGTDFKKVQDASVKRQLAIDSNNKKLSDIATNEIIGHLSSENKEPYLKNAQPLQNYIEAKDKFDFKHNNYTTTQNVDKTPDENVRALQRELNEAGYTDKFGQPLKEDGIYAGKTAYADDKRKAAESTPVTDNSRYKTATINGKEYQVEYPIATKEDLQPKMLSNSEVKLASNNQTAQLTNYKSNSSNNNSNSNNFDYNTRLSYNQNYNSNVQILQEKLSELGYLDMSGGGWGYFGPKTVAAVNAYKKDAGLGNTGKDKGVVGKDTWGSLGLIYRTQEDIKAGVEIVTIEGKQYKDVSIPINDALNRDKHLFEENADDLDWFGAQVGDTGPWNIKRCDEDSYTWEETIGLPFPGYDKIMILFGHKVTVEDIGNITYGYLGKAAKLTDATLYLGSAWNDYKNHGFSNIDGETRDRYWIGVGINWYNDTIK